MRRRPELCAALWAAAHRMGTLALSYPTAGALRLRPTSRFWWDELDDYQTQLRESQLERDRLRLELRDALGQVEY